MPKITDERRAEVRNRLIDATIQLLLAEGPTAATSRRILDQAELSAGALYHYFSSLDELFAAVAERFAEADEPFLEAASDLGDDPAEALVAIHAAVLRDIFTPGHHTILGQLRVAAQANEGVRNALVHYDEITVERFGALNRATQEAGVFRADVDPEALVEVIGTFFEGFATKGATTGYVAGRERVLGLFLDMVGDRLLEPDCAAVTTFRRLAQEVAAQSREADRDGTPSAAVGPGAAP